MVTNQANEQQVAIEDREADKAFSAACFGGPRLSTGSLPTDRLFTGQIRDLGDDRFYFFKARYYDATIGRFQSSDSIVPKADNPQALNRYAYALNNPLRLVDPSGHDPMDPNWVKQFEAAHGGQAPRQQDWQDYQFSLSHPGTGQQGSWTAEDWSLFSNLENSLGSGVARSVWPSLVGAEQVIDGQILHDLAGRLESPDYYTGSFNISIPNPYTGSLVGPTFQLTRDRYNRWYVTLGASIGKSPLFVSGSVVAGWIIQGQPAGRQQLEGFLTEWSANVSAGSVVGGGVTWGNVGSFHWSDLSGEIGVFYPWQFGATVSYTWEVG